MILQGRTLQSCRGKQGPRREVRKEDASTSVDSGFPSSGLMRYAVSHGCQLDMADPLLTLTLLSRISSTLCSPSYRLPASSAFSCLAMWRPNRPWEKFKAKGKIFHFYFSLDLEGFFFSFLWLHHSVVCRTSVSHRDWTQAMAMKAWNPDH